MNEYMEKLGSQLTPKNIIIGLGVLLLLSVIGMAYFYQQANSDPQKVAKEELDKAVAQIGKLIVLPKDETPTLATVSDPDKLKDQPFFANAKKGDKVLIYTIAKKAILYSPSLNKIIEVAPVNAGNSGGQTNIPLQKSQ